MIRTRVKICGITSVKDAEFSMQSGADAIGLVFYDKSPRFISVELATEIVSRVGPFITVVGLFVNPIREYVETVVDQTGINLLQFHGDETEYFCRGFSRPYIKAVRMSEGTDINQIAAEYSSARGILCDAWQEGKYGGTGKTFDWHRLPEQRNFRLILAGGLTAENVDGAVKQLSPYAVDVSGGVEISPGIKDPKRVSNFIDMAKFGVL